MKKQILLLSLALVIIGYISIFIGVSNISFMDILTLSDKQTQVLIISRLPRFLSIVCVGMGLSVAGLIMQYIMSNPFVSPSTGSTVAWARLGILFVLLFFGGANTILKMGIVSIFAFCGSLIFVKLTQKLKLKDAVLVPLIGIMLGNVVSSIVGFIAYRYNLIPNISSWLQGSFTMVIRGRYELLYIGIPLLIAAFLYADKFTISSMGKDVATNLGIDYKKIVTIGIIIASLITSVVITTVGSISFIGIIVPNIVRMYYGDNFKYNVWIIALTGALFLLVCDILARLLLYPFEIPVGIIAGILGGIIFLILLIRGKVNGKKQ
jgi:ABC-type enterochelin transport system, permease component